MIFDVKDLKGRTLVESNTLKSFILSATDGFHAPSLDDIVIHDYQLANSVTLNTILSNYVENLKYACKEFYGSSGSNDWQPYFRMLDEIDESSAKLLDDNTKLVLTVKDGDGTFQTKKLVATAENLKNPGDVRYFVNLDAMWYGIKESKEDSCDSIVVIEGMNDTTNPFGKVNPFDVEGEDGSFNAQMKAGGWKINCIVENLFYGNVFQDSGDGAITNLLSKCRYLACIDKDADGSLVGLQPTYGQDGAFAGFKMHRLESEIGNLGSDTWHFKNCGFAVVDDEVTLVVVLQRDGDKIHYVCLNEQNCDSTYGMFEIDKVVIDQLVTDVENVFRKVESIKQLDDISIVLTDYGFWDVERNKTNDITMSFNGTKTIHDSSINLMASKLVVPEATTSA